MIKPTNFLNVARPSRIRKTMGHVVSSLVPNRCWRNRVRAIFQFGIWRTLATFWREGRETFPYYFSIAAIIRDEGRYLREWIEYHQMVGAEKFYIYDNQSTDNTRQILKPYIDAGIVEYHYVVGDGIQHAVNLFAARRAAHETKWLAVIDLDEFIMPMRDATVPQFLRQMNPRIAQIFIRWCLYGSSGHVARPRGLVTQNYKYRKHDNSDQANKMIVNPRMVVSCPSAHTFSVIGRSVDETGRSVTPSPVIPGIPQDIIRINHYRCKSWADSQEKHIKGDATFGRDYVRYTRADFDRYDTNDVRDDSMDKYADQLRRRCGID